MKILHTSDWHLGHTLYGTKRQEEFEAFLAWLTEVVQQRAISVLLIAGDIFDSNTPSNQAQALYYRFLCAVAATECRHVVVVAGNHDSPSLLEAPKELLKILNVYVVGSVGEALDDEVLLLRDREGRPELIVCAVPYLRDREMRLAAAGESSADKERKLLHGITQHYAQVAQVAQERLEQLERPVPVVAMGHLFAAGGQTSTDDGVRDLYIGSLARITADIFADTFDYVALGHLHTPQVVNQRETIRYSGAPLAMGFGEARQRKCVVVVELGAGAPRIDEVEVPVFQCIERITGDWDTIAARLRELVQAQSAAWLEVVYNGQELFSDLCQRVEEVVGGSNLQVLRFNNNRFRERVLQQSHAAESLDDLDKFQVFARCLDAHEVAEEQRPELWHRYREVVQQTLEHDVKATD